MAGGGQMRPIGKDGMPASGVSDITPMPSAPMPGGKGGQNGEIPRPTPTPAPGTQYSPIAAPAQAPSSLAPQGNFKLCNQ